MEWYYWVLLYFVIGYISSSLMFAICVDGWANSDEKLVGALFFWVWPITLTVVIIMYVGMGLIQSPMRMGAFLREKFMQFKRKRDEAKQAKKRAAELKALKAETEDC
jgi:hypothetical protein